MNSYLKTCCGYVIPSIVDNTCKIYYDNKKKIFPRNRSKLGRYYDAMGNTFLRSIRKQAFTSLFDHGVDVDGAFFTFSKQAFDKILHNTMYQDMLPDDIYDALFYNSFSYYITNGTVIYCNPNTKTKVLVEFKTRVILSVFLDKEDVEYQPPSEIKSFDPDKPLMEYWGPCIQAGGGSAFIDEEDEQVDSRLQQLREKELEQKPLQMHHFITNKNKLYTKEFRKILDKYSLNLNQLWNKERLPHVGRHCKEYHEWIYDQLTRIDGIAKGDVEIFLREFDKVKEIVRNDPDIMYRRGWDNKED